MELKEEKTKKTAPSVTKETKTTVLQIVVLLVCVSIAYYIGSLSTEVNFYRKNLSNLNNLQNPNQDPNGQVADAQGEGEVPQPIKNLDKPSNDDHIYGNKNANIAIVEYSDFSCPFCATFHKTAKSVVDASEGKVMWVYRNFPLLQLHPDAQKQAIAAECVANLAGNDAYWKFTDILFESKPALATLGDVVQKELGVNKDQFNDCYNNDKTAGRIERDVKSAEAVGVNGTPGNFILNIKTGMALPLRGAVPADVLNTSIQMMEDAN